MGMCQLHDMCSELVAEGVAGVDSIGGSAGAAFREAAISAFRAGRTALLLTTDLLARGIDFVDVATGELLLLGLERVS